MGSVIHRPHAHTDVIVWRQSETAQVAPPAGSHYEKEDKQPIILSHTHFNEQIRVQILPHMHVFVLWKYKNRDITHANTGQKHAR